MRFKFDLNNLKKKNILISVFIVLFLLIISAATYAYLIVSMNVLNGNYVYNTGCFDIVYSALNDDGTTDMVGDLEPSSTYKDGLVGQLAIGKDPSCDVNARGNIYLKLNSSSSNASVLTKKVTAHCENATTLETLTSYTSKSACEAKVGNVWVTNGTALKYVVFEGTSKIPVTKGYINEIGELINLHGGFRLTNKWLDDDNWAPMDYEIYIWLDGNVSDNSYAGISVSGSVSAEAVQSLTALPEEPVLDYGMIPIVFNEGEAKTIGADDANWYDYDNGKWANVVLVTPESRNNYLNTSGVSVDTNDILAYYVWIPRYKYKLFPGTTTTNDFGYEQSIEIVFESVDAPKSTGTAVGEYRTHPAFTFGDVEVEGIWVGKFETTGTAETPTIKEYKDYLVGLNASEAFVSSLKFSGGSFSDGIVTFGGSSYYGLSKNTDSHMMKNSEWGAVAYLSYSKYGRNENAINGYLASFSPEIDNDGFASTTVSSGVLYGVYAMAGGVAEQVMAKYNGANDNYSGFDSVLPDLKYYDLYSYDFGQECGGSVCYGHAMTETYGWYGQYYYYPNDYVHAYWIYRGGAYSHVGGANDEPTLLDYGIYGGGSLSNQGEEYIGGYRSVIIPNVVGMDSTNPVLSLSATGASYYSKSASVTLAAIDTGSGIAPGQSVKYRWQTDSICSTDKNDYTLTANLSNTSASATSATATLTASGLTGEYYLCIYSNIEDGAGNTNTLTRSSGTFLFDNTAPGIPTWTLTFADGSGTYSSSTHDIDHSMYNGWTNKQVNANVSVVEADSGIDIVQFSTDGGSGWYNWDFGVSNLTQSGETWTGIESFDLYDRETTGVLRACDVVGNCSSMSTALIIKYDVSAPIVTFGTNGNSSYAKSVSSTITVSDNAVGADVSTYKYIYSSLSTATPIHAFYHTPDSIYSISSGTGTIYLIAYACDLLGNCGTTTSNPFYLDNTGPTITFGTDGSSWTKTASSTISVSDSHSGGNSSTYKYIYSTSSTASPTTAFTSGSSYSKSSVTGTYYLRAYACDSLGNCTTKTSSAFYLDNTAPSVPSVSSYLKGTNTTYTGTSWVNKQIYSTLSSSDSHSGVSYMQYSTNQSSWSTFSFSVSALKQSGTTWTGTAAWGTLTRQVTEYMRACDAAGNCSSNTSMVIKYDATAPTVTVNTYYGQDEEYSGGWYTFLHYRDIWTVVSYSDDHSGINQTINYKDVGDSSFSTMKGGASSTVVNWGDQDGRGNAQIKVCDMVNNCTTKTIAMKKDSTPPTCVVNIDLDGNGEYGSATLTYGDAFSGVREYGMRVGQNTSYTIGQTQMQVGTMYPTAYAYVTDNAGNTKYCSKTLGE